MLTCAKVVSMPPSMMNNSPARWGKAARCLAVLF